MEECRLCPRKCRVDRNDEGIGYCGQSSRIMAARAALHMWEEPCISGEKGSGTVFFSGCTLHCVFCQNESIANGSVGKNISEERLSEIFLELMGQGANNINLVTAGHFAPAVARALEMAKHYGMNLPVVYNTGGYESMETLKIMDGLVDIYLPDLKYVDKEISRRYSHAEDYFDRTHRAIEEMVRQTGKPEFLRTRDKKILSAKEYNEYCDEGDEILMKRGTIVRHLILPGNTKDSKNVLRYLQEQFGDDIFISIMSQYTPLKNVKEFPELCRSITEKEYDEVVDYAIEIGIENAFIQEGTVASESFIPDFSLQGI